MTRTEHLLTILGEEAAEVAQRASKALRFGLAEVQPGQPLSNSERVSEELSDLLAVYLMLRQEASAADRYLWPVFGGHMGDRMGAKRAKVEKFLAYSAECGTLAAPGGNTKGG